MHMCVGVYRHHEDEDAGYAHRADMHRNNKELQDAEIMDISVYLITRTALKRRAQMKSQVKTLLFMTHQSHIQSSNSIQFVYTVEKERSQRSWICLGEVVFMYYHVWE